MNLPNVITELVTAQNNFDSVAYANCFTETATVIDEGNNYQGRTEIRNWIADANEKYKAVMNPIQYSENGSDATLSAEVSGDFPGSPVVLYYALELEDELIRSLQIT